MASLPTSVTTTQPELSQEKLSQDELLSWSVHLIRRQPGSVPRLTFALAGVFALSLCLFHSFGLALLPVVLVLLSMSEFVFPIRYTLTPLGAKARYGLTLLEISWADVRHAYLTDDGVKLSPLRAKNSRFEALRGVYLRFDDANREEVIAAVRRGREEAANCA